MSKRMRVKPSKFGSTLGFVGGLVFCGIGIFILIKDFNIFSFMWTLIAFLITSFYGINLFTEKGISLYSVTIKEDDEKKKTKK